MEFRGAEASDVVVVGIEADVRGVWEVCDHLLAVRDARPLRFVLLLLPGRSEFEMTAAASLGAEAVLPRTASVETLREAVIAVADGGPWWLRVCPSACSPTSPACCGAVARRWRST